MILSVKWPSTDSKDQGGKSNWQTDITKIKSFLICAYLVTIVITKKKKCKFCLFFCNDSIPTWLVQYLYRKRRKMSMFIGYTGQWQYCTMKVDSVSPCNTMGNTHLEALILVAVSTNMSKNCFILFWENRKNMHNSCCIIIPYLSSHKKQEEFKKVGHLWKYSVKVSLSTLAPFSLQMRFIYSQHT